MSIQAQINRIKTNVENSFVAVAAKGGTVPQNQNSDNLADAIMGIPAGGGEDGSQYFIAITFDSAFSGRPYTVTGPEEEIHTGTVPTSLQETVQVYHGASEYTVTSTDSNGAKCGATVLIGSLFGTYTVKLNRARIYGVTWDGTATTKLSRTDDAIHFVDPTPAVGSGNGSSPFDSCFPWSGMEKVIDGDNVLVKIPKYWVKISHAPFRVQISDKAIPGYQVSPAHRDREDGQGERDVVYIGRYECDDSYMSRAAQYPLPTTSKNRAGFREGIHALGPEYWQADYALQLTWWFLYIVEFADWNGQATIGRGVVDGVDGAVTINTGGTDSMTYHTGRAAGTDGFTAVQYRGIENLWGNTEEWRDGILFVRANIYTFNNPSNFADSESSAGAVLRGIKRVGKSNWIKAWGSDPNDPSFIFPSEGGGSETEFVPDYCYYSSALVGLIVGGGPNTVLGGYKGPFNLKGTIAPRTQTVNYCSRLMKLPNNA